MRSSIRITVIAAAIAAVAGLAGAQPPAGGPGGRGVAGGVPGGVRGGVPGGVPGPGTMEFMGTEIPFGPIVKGAPFSAEGVTKSSQTLGDGTKISRTVNAKIYRDSEGRIRREQTILGLGALSTSNEPVTLVTIVDPVAGVQYVLNAARKQAYRSPMPAPGGGRGGVRGRSGQQGVDIGGVPPPPPPPPPPAGEVERGARRGGPPAGLPNVPQPLGDKQIEGVNASGRKWTETIPAGTIGNDRPITITDERWESSELKVLVSSDHHDPRTGDVTYRLTNINRSEPDGVLFTVPADYTVTDAPPPPPPAPGGRGRGRAM